MSRPRKTFLLLFFTISVVSLVVSSYLRVLSGAYDELSSAEYSHFCKLKGSFIGGEVHFSEKDEITAGRLLLRMFNSEESKMSARLANCSYICIRVSIASFIAGLFTLSYNIFKKSGCWLYRNPDEMILFLAVSFFLATWIFLPFIRSGRIEYSFIFASRLNGSRIFWALMFVEWGIVLLPLGLIYRRYIGKIQSDLNS